MTEEHKLPKYAYAGCGHKMEVKNLPRRPYALKNVVHGAHTISWMSLCKQCYQDKLEKGDVLLTVKQQEDWLAGGKKAKSDRSIG